MSVRNVEDSLSIYDPRNNEDYVFGPYPDGSFISSVAEQLLVICIPPSFELISSENSVFTREVLEQFNLNHGVGVICGFTTPKLIDNLFPCDSTIYGQGKLGYFPTNESNFKLHMDILKKVEYGELTIGCVNKRLDDVESFVSCNNKKYSFGDFELLPILSKTQEVKWLISFYADTGHGIIIIKRKECSDSFLEFLQKLNQPCN